MFLKLIKHLIYLLSIIVLVACGGGSGGGSNQGSNGNSSDNTSSENNPNPGDNTADMTPPAASITFPPGNAITNSNTITIRGTASDTDEIMVVRANNNDVMTSDNFANWMSDISLDDGINNIMIETGDIALNSNNAAASINITNIARFPRDIALDTTNNRALIVDNLIDAVISIDLTLGANQGNEIILSDANNGMGTLLSNPTNIVLDNTGDRAFISDGATILSVDLTPGASLGDRTIVSDINNGSGINFIFIAALALDGDNNRLLVADYDFLNLSGSIVAVDLTPGTNFGNRSIISNGTNGSGPNLSNPISIAFDSINNQLFVADLFTDSVITVNTTAGTNLGNRTIISSDANGSGPSLTLMQGIALDSANNRLLITEDFSNALIAVDLNAGANFGDRTVVVDNSIGTGTSMDAISRLALDSSNNQALVLDTNSVKQLFAIDLSTGPTLGNRSIITDDRIGSGPELQRPRDILFDETNNRLLVINRRGAFNAISTINLNADINFGDREIISDNNNGTGPNFSNPQHMALNNGQLFVVDTNLDAVLSVELTPGSTLGNRTIISNSANGSGTNFMFPRGLDLDSSNNRLLITDTTLDALMTVDLNTGTTFGNRAVVSDSSNGNGPNFISPINLVSDSANNRAFVLDSGLDAVFMVDLRPGATFGDRSIISNSSNGSGTNISNPINITLDSANNQLIITDLDLDALIAIDLTPGIHFGNRSILSDDNNGSGIVFSGPQGVATDSVNDIAFVTDSDLDVMFAIDMRTGTRVVVSK